MLSKEKILSLNTVNQSIWLICFYQKNNIAVEVNEYSQSDRDNNYKTKGEEILKKKTWVSVH